MNIYISHAGNNDYETELYAPIKSSELYKHHEIFLPHESQNIDVPARDVLRHTDLLVAEVSSPSTGQGIELGLAAAAGVPIVCFYREGCRSLRARFASLPISVFPTANRQTYSGN